MKRRLNIPIPMLLSNAAPFATPSFYELGQESLHYPLQKASFDLYAQVQE
jgi:hypothetical protein